MLTGDGKSLPVEDGAVDFVYSFITLMHLQSFAAFRSYLRETYRVLRPGGLAHLYYGLTEIGVKERKAPVNELSLSMSREVAKDESQKAGFEVLDNTGVSWRFGEKELRHGYQGSILLRK
jgi:ubiquinone/menaquinone biosynthesis C-methylase UbiE